jgi:hypothetical protein
MRAMSIFKSYMGIIAIVTLCLLFNTLIDNFYDKKKESVKDRTAIENYYDLLNNKEYWLDSELTMMGEEERLLEIRALLKIHKRDIADTYEQDEYVYPLRKPKY